MNRKKCKYKECTNPVWSGGLCQNHIGKKPIQSKKTIDLKAIKSEKRHVERKPSITRYMLFLSLWKKRGNKSEVSNETLYGEPSSAYFHHILPKSKFPEADLDEENIIILTIDEHNNVENDMYKYELINKRRYMLLKKYNLI